MTRTVLTGIVCLLLGSAIGSLRPLSIQAATGQKQSMIYGSGTRSCGSWVDFKTLSKVSDEQKWAAGNGIQWVEGFVSGVGWADRYKQKETDMEGINAFITKYCLEHPLADIAEAAQKLTLDLTIIK
jgi:hypothetical protein